MSLLQMLSYSVYNNLIKNKDWVKRISTVSNFSNFKNKDPQDVINYLDKKGYTVEQFYKLLEKYHISPQTGDCNDESKNFKPTLKIAILIANAHYEHWSELVTPISDCEVLGNILKSMGFITIIMKNCSSSNFRKSITDLCEKIPPESYVLFYFAGHGFELCGTKYMLGVESPPEKYKVEHGVSENFIIKNVFSSRPDLFILLLDMCRKQPDRTVNPDIYLNIPPMEEYKNMCNLIVGYATSPYMPAFEIEIVKNKLCGDTESSSSYIQHDSCELNHNKNSSIYINSNVNDEYDTINNRETCKLTPEKQRKGISLYVDHLSKHLKKKEDFIHILELVHKEFANEQCEQASLQKPQKLDNVSKEFYLHVKVKGDKRAQKELKTVTEKLREIVDIKTL